MDKPRNGIYIRNLPPGTRKEALRPLFEPFGTLRECRVQPRRSTALILFVNEECVSKAIQEENYTIISRFPIQINSAFVHRELEPRSRIAIRGVRQ
jgi:RNA recognition motif-containing protein